MSTDEWVFLRYSVKEILQKLEKSSISKCYRKWKKNTAVSQNKLIKNYQRIF